MIFTENDFPVANLQTPPPISYKHAEIANAKIAPILTRMDALERSMKVVQHRRMELEIQVIEFEKALGEEKVVALRKKAASAHKQLLEALK